MPKPSERLQTVLRLAQLREQAAAERLGEATRQLQTHAQQADQLRDYQQEYVRDFQQRGGQPVSARQLSNYQHFYRNLEQAVDTQTERVALIQSQRDNAREEWTRQYARQKNLEKLIQRKAAEEQREEEKKLQREQDDRPRRRER